MTEKKNLKISVLEINKGQIEGVPANPRILKKDKFKKLKQSIEENPEMLDLRELLVYPLDNKYVIIGGNMRFEVCKQLGYKELPCKIIDKETPAENLRAYVLRDNASYGEWDFDLLANEWNVDEIDIADIELPEDLLPEEKEVVEDGYKVPDETETICKTGERWKLGNHILYCGDSTKSDDVEKLMGGVVADLCVTDPPYNVNYEGKTKEKLKIQNDKKSVNEFEDFLCKAFKNLADNIKNGGAFYVWFAVYSHVAFKNALLANHLPIKQELIWNKNVFTLGRSDYQWKHEPCFYGWKEGAGHYFCNERNHATVIEDKINIDKLNKNQMRDLLHELLDEKNATTILDCEKPVRNAEHPTMKPIKLMGYLIKNSSKENEIVLDLFGGSGSTLIACEQLNRRCYIMEYDPHYCDVIIDRWQKFTGETAERLE